MTNTSGLPNAYSYPNFERKTIATRSADSAQNLLAFPSKVKGKRKDDLIVFGLGADPGADADINPPGANVPSPSSDVTLFENPRNRDRDTLASLPEAARTQWGEITLQTLPQPAACTMADVTGNDFHDVIVADEYGHAAENANPYGGRVSWLENFGTDEGEWTRREIGRYPGVNCLKVGHFTTTFSLQVLAIVKSPRSDIPAPLIIFTHPKDVYKSRYWLATLALETSFSAIQDCIIVREKSDGLDRVIISSREGLAVAWYSNNRWHRRFITDSMASQRQPRPGQLAAGKVKNDLCAFIVAAEANHGSTLSIYAKCPTTLPNVPFETISWTCVILDDPTCYPGTATRYSRSIRDVVCADLDGDGDDEILVSILSDCDALSGIYYFDLVNGDFVKYKISNEPAEKFGLGHFVDKTKRDFATISCSLPRTISIHHTSFITSEVKAFLRESGLIFYVPAVANITSEIDIMDLAGRTHTLVVLPPNAALPFCPEKEGTHQHALKVLHGCVGWIDSRGRLVERTRAVQPGCVASMLVDCPEGVVRSGNDGAVFVRMRPSSGPGSGVGSGSRSGTPGAGASARTLKAINLLPAYFPSEITSHEFVWRKARHLPWFPAKSAGDKELYHLPGYQLCFESPDGTTISPFAYVHMWAAAPKVSSGYHKQNISPLSTYGHPTCSIRACLSNPSGESGLLIRRQAPTNSTGGPNGTGALPSAGGSVNAARGAAARKVTLKTMCEHGPIWKVKEDEQSGEVVVDYPWHAWVAGAQPTGADAGEVKWDVWAAFDFPPFAGREAQTETRPGSCIIA